MLRDRVERVRGSMRRRLAVVAEMQVVSSRPCLSNTIVMPQLPMPAEGLRVAAHVAAERAGVAVGVGLVGVVVDVAAPVRRHERVARRVRRLDGVRRGGRAAEQLEPGELRGDLGDRRGRRARRPEPRRSLRAPALLRASSASSD